MQTTKTLQTLHEAGWRYGLANLWQKESHAWWSRLRWLWQALLWILILDGFTAGSLAGLANTKMASSSNGFSLFTNGLVILVDFLLIFPAIGVIVQVQGKIIDERQNGTVAWILSKPVSRAAFILSKFAALPGILLFSIVVPALLGIGELFIATKQLPAFGLVLLAILLTASHLLLYYSLTLLIQTVIKNRTVVIGVLLVIFLLEMSVSPNALALPLALGNVPVALASILTLTLAALLCLFISINVFSREEF